MYKLVAMDLDGTILRDDCSVSKEDIEIIGELRNRDIEVVFASGRRYFSMKEVLSDLIGDFVFIANNGNLIRTTRGNKTLYKEFLSYGEVKPAIDDGKKLGLDPVIHVNCTTGKADMIVEKNPNSPGYLNYIEGEESVLYLDSFSDRLDMEILSVVYLGTNEKLLDFKNFIDSKYGSRYKTYLMTNVEAAESLLEILNPRDSKWTSILKYASSLGIEPSEIITIGDDSNDREMIKKSGLGIAMKNAIDEVKEVADIVTSLDNNNSGVSDILKKLLKGELDE